ncbi:MAG TPA: GNAT family N-acetyltransferase [Tepidisphaeraceae bacterium]|nr:GNAT family N-acetyltransferase [Tepidisphaeraceae bacterium]
MEIRPATPEDVPAVLPMVRKIAGMHEALDAAKYGFRSDPGEMYRGWLTSHARGRKSVFLVADAGGSPPKLAGFLIGTIEHEIPIYRVEQFGFVHDVWVEEDYRNEGVGRQLVTMAVERFGDLGVEQVRCDTSWKNEIARNLFTACGFRPSVVEMLIEI